MDSPSCVAILVVEDQEPIRKLVVQFLEADGFHVYQAENNEHAVQVLRDMPRPALILADLMMPAPERPSLVTALGREDRFVILPMVVVSAAETASSDGYSRVKKPIDFGDLLRIVSGLCLRRI